MENFVSKKISRGIYLYRGFVLIGHYHSPEGRVCWEAIDDDGTGFAHSFSLRDTKKWVDYEIDVNRHPVGKYKKTSDVCVDKLY